MHIFSFNYSYILKTRNLFSSFVKFIINNLTLIFIVSNCYHDSRIMVWLDGCHGHVYPGCLINMSIQDVLSIVAYLWYIKPFLLPFMLYDSSPAILQLSQNVLKGGLSSDQIYPDQVSYFQLVFNDFPRPHFPNTFSLKISQNITIRDWTMYMNYSRSLIFTWWLVHWVRTSAA